MYHKITHISAFSVLSLLLLTGCGGTGDSGAEGETAEPDTEVEETEEETEEEEEEAPVPSLEDDPEPHEMSHALRDDSDWYLFAPADYHNAQEWEASGDSPTYDTDAERIEEYSCVLGSTHYQGNWYSDAALGAYLPAGYQPQVADFNVSDADTPSGETEMSVAMTIPCETWAAAVEAEGLNPDLYTRQIHFTEEAATSLLSLDQIAEGVLALDPEAPDLRSDEVPEVYYRVVLDQPES